MGLQRYFSGLIARLFLLIAFFWRVNCSPIPRRAIDSFVSLDASSDAWAATLSGIGPLILLVGDRVTKQLLRNVQRQLPRGHLVRADNKALLKRIIDYIDEPDGVLDIKLDIRGTEFQKKVFAAMREIPAGQTSSFTDIASKIGEPKAIRAVGNACSTNNLALAIPCHRVLHRDGTLSGGYHWGDARQRVLLDREAAVAPGGG